MAPPKMEFLRRHDEVRDILVDALRLKICSDLRIVCKEGALGTLQCHRLVVAAQSKFLQTLMLDADIGGGENHAVIAIPDVKVSDMKIVVRFLYTGKLRLTKNKIPIVKHLLENVLKIDAHIRLPDTDVAVPTTDDDQEGDDRQGGDGHGGGGDSGNGSDSDPSTESGPPKKRFKSNNLEPQNPGGSTQKLQEHEAVTISTPFPPSPPHSYTEDDEIVVDDEDSVQDVVDLAPQYIAEDVGSSNSLDSSSSSKEPIDEHECKFCSRTFATAQELYPHIVEHVAKGQVDIPKEPMINVARETGSIFEQPMPQYCQEDDESRDASFAPANYVPSRTEGRVTRLQSGALFAPEQMYAEEDFAFELPLLPPPIPEPPEPGMQILKGHWVTEARYNRVKKRTAAPGNRTGSKVRKYNYTPGVTISGKSKAETFVRPPTGVFACDVDGCGLLFDNVKSLRSHKSRSHNPNLTVKCPECPTMLCNQHAIKKHLLSHRPESQWPYQCPLCFKKFQAKGDLPKHFLTLRHKSDPRIPARGTPEWRSFIELGVCVPGPVTSNRRSRGLVAPDQISLQPPPNDDDEAIVVQMENIEEEEEDIMEEAEATHDEKSLIPCRISQSDAVRASGAVLWPPNK